MGRIRAKIKPRTAIALGIFLNLIGFVWWEGPGASESLHEYVALVGNLLRRDILVNLLSIPSYVLFFGGIAALLQQRASDSRRLTFLRHAILLVALVAIVLRALRIAVTVIATGTEDLDSPSFVITAPSWIVDAWHPLLLRGLNAFVLAVILCLIALVAIAVRDARPGSTAETIGEPKRQWIKPWAIALGGVLYLIAAALSSFGERRPADLAEYIGMEGSLVRRDALVTVALSVPGYLLFFLGIAILLRTKASSSRTLGILSRVLGLVAVVAAVADVMWVVVALIASGSADLDAPNFSITAPDWLTTLWAPLFNVAGIALTACVGICLVGLIVNALHESVDTRNV